MIELKRDGLVFSFPEVHKDAVLRIGFQRTLRIPDDGRDYDLPPGLGEFPLRHVDDFAGKVPAPWLEHGGVMLPMYQSEALWIHFQAFHGQDRAAAYPFAVKIAAGKINAVTGQQWSDGLRRRPQDYMAVPRQPWLDGYCVEKGIIRQFVAMPLGSGYSAEEQLTGAAEHGGLQIIVHPMKAEAFERRFPRIDHSTARMARSIFHFHVPQEAMALAPGGRMRQEIYEDPYDFDEWDQAHSSRCFAHLANALVWRAITGQAPPTVPPTAKEYTAAGLPWFKYYAEGANALAGSSVLQKVKSVVTKAAEKGDVALPENESVTPEKVIQLREGLRKGQVREGVF